MNDLPRQTLRRILAKYGAEICSDARRCESLLKDLCGSHRREINVLVKAIEERVPLDLLAANRSMPFELLLTKLEKRLEEQTAMTAEAASWAVESWALALDLTTETEIQTRRKRIESAAPQIQKTETNRPNASASSGSIPNVNLPKPAPKQPPTVPQTRTAPPPIIRQPAPMPKSPPPPVVLPRTAPPSSPLPAPPQTTNQPVVARRGLGFFRGCLLVVFLLAAVSVGLFLGVPYAIEVMRETQRERNNEPPRFPVR